MNGFMVPVHQSLVATSSLVENRPGLSMSANSNKKPNRDYGDSKRNFAALKKTLTQQAVRSCVFYMNEFRDDVTVQWLKKYDEEMKRATSTEYLKTLMTKEPEQVKVQRIMRRAMGGSGTNPYLKNSSSFEYTVDINPKDIAQRLLKIRAQIATEMIQDLKLVRVEDEEVVRHRSDVVNFGEEEAEGTRRAVHDFTDPFSDSTPYRFETYTILMDKITDIALNRFKSEARILNRSKDINWLEDILKKNGDLKNGALLEKIMDGKMSITSRSGSSKPKVIDPMGIAQEIMSYREEAAEELSKSLEGIQGENARISLTLLENSLKMEMDEADAVARENKFGFL
eukprot:CAMPEP_0113945376 /NCGR_PEP_ID=MMETSP1339-20121228/44946_1 /TAXON_ID=94617 /ORGANISM="Fibrocapsa japonica" /LENGTH=340 /DNA_ID=CAMNT_0000950933 /DNA_START=190 /DNA_END=1212 /DNA_ORIENTATION=- /assembly_acc=CAM_ASM_000762